MEKSNIGLIGLAVMGENLILNMASKGFRVTAYARRLEAVESFLNGRAKNLPIIGTNSLEKLVESLEKPRKVMMMIKAGQPVDDVIEQLIPLLDQGDIIIDGGNSYFEDTMRRTKYVESKGLLFIGTGVSGGEEGALLGPSIMPGGSKKAWVHVEPIFKKIAAKVDDIEVCADWVGENGAGHFVKMVHNGIEYGDIQLISEAYHLMRNVLKMSADEMHEVFSTWNEGELDSYLIEITADILKVKDDDGLPLIDKILDTAGQKGTGKWTVNQSLEHGVPLTLIAESVYARILSSMKDERIKAAKIFKETPITFNGDKKAFVEDIKKSLYAAKIMSYAQGFSLMNEASKAYQWHLNLGKIALLWRGGCIIRSAFLGKIKEAFDQNLELANLMLAPYFKEIIESSIHSFRTVISTAVLNGIPTPSMSAALNYFDGYKTENLPANLLQAQRDYFGAHTYERIDKKRGEFFHTNWTGRGGKTASTTYNI